MCHQFAFAAPPLTIRFIYFVPSDKAVRLDFQQGVENAATSLQGWYPGQLGGKTITLNSPISEVCRGTAPADYFSTSSYSRVFNAVKACVPELQYNDPQYRYVIYADVRHACNAPERLGAGGSGVTIMPIQDLEGLSAQPIIIDDCGESDRFVGTSGVNRWIGGLGHELGHALGLPHPPGCDAGLSSCDQNALMWAGYASYPNTFLRADEKPVLFATPFFSGTALQTTAPVGLSRRGGIDIDGSRKSVLVVRSSAKNQLQAGRLVNGSFQWTVMADPGPNFAIEGAVDLSGLGKSDLAFLDVTNLNSSGQGTAQFLPNFVSTSPQFLRLVKPAWRVDAVGDLDGDGYGDLVWRFTGNSGNIDDTGVSYIWFTGANGVAQVRKRGGAPLDWTLLGAQDLNGDGAADMVYVSPSNAVRVLMATPNRTCANLSAGNLSAGYIALHLADYTGSGRGDLLTRNPATGAVQLISLNAIGLPLPAYAGAPDDPNASCTSSAVTLNRTVQDVSVSTDAAWTYYASGDFDGDGIFDVVWKRPDNSLVIWLMKASGASPVIILNAGAAPAGHFPIALQ